MLIRLRSTEIPEIDHKEINLFFGNVNGIEQIRIAHTGFLSIAARL
jgi:hypothetical protein